MRLTAKMIDEPSAGLSQMLTHQFGNFLHQYDRHARPLPWRVGRKHEARFQWERALRLEPEEDGMAAKIEDKLRDGLIADEDSPVSN